MAASPFDNARGRVSPRRTSRRVEERRRPYDLDRLTGVALAVFAERGYDGASMDDVARAAGITKAAIYHHVASKEALLARGIDRALAALFGVLEEPAAREGRAIARLRYVVRSVARLALRVRPELTVLVRVRGNSATERDARERRRAFDRHVATIVREAQSDGDIDAALDASVVTKLVFGMCNSVVEWYRDDGPLAANSIAEHVERLLFETFG